MPTLNPRISVTLTPEVSAVLRELCDLTGTSQSAMVAEIITNATPVFERMAQVLRAAQEVKGQLTEEMAGSLQAAHSKIEKQLGIVFENLDEGTRPILEVAEGIKRRGGAGARSRAPAATGRAPAPMSNRGVTPHPAKEKKRRPVAVKGGRRG